MLYKTLVPSVDLVELCKSESTLFALPVHEAIEEEFREDPSILLRLEEAVADGSLPVCYHEHVLVKGASEPVLPMSLFVDGLPYSNADGVVGFWVVNEITLTRHLTV